MSHASSTAIPSTPNKPSSQLPNEILQYIAQLVDDVDLPALRATSTVFRDEVEVRFANTYFTDVYNPVTPEGLERLTKIAVHPLFSQKVRNCIGTAETPMGYYMGLRTRKAFKDIATVMQARNFGVLLVDDRSQHSQNSRAVEYAKYLAWLKRDQFTMDVRYPIGSVPDKSCILKHLYCVRLRMNRHCTFVVRFLQGKARNAPASATLEVNKRAGKLTCTGSHDYFHWAEALFDPQSLVEIDLSQWTVPGPCPHQHHDSLQHIGRHQSMSLRRLVVRDAHTTSSWEHRKLVVEIMSCRLDFCHLSNLTSSGDGVEFLGTLEAGGTDNIRACLRDMKWTSKTDENVVPVT